LSRTKVDWIAELPNIKAMGLDGARMPEIAKKYGVSRQRVKQILNRYIPEWHTLYGGVVLRERLHQENKITKWKRWGHREDTDIYRAQRHKFIRKKANSKRTGYSWTIDFGDLEWPLHCPILGLELDYFAESAQENSPSFDRIDSNLGYDKGNVQIISWRANRIKSNGTPEEHRKIADYLDKYYG
jgi:hypothetical protein